MISIPTVETRSPQASRTKRVEGLSCAQNGSCSAEDSEPEILEIGEFKGKLCQRRATAIEENSYETSYGGTSRSRERAPCRGPVGQFVAVKGGRS